MTQKNSSNLSLFAGVLRWTIKKHSTILITYSFLIAIFPILVFLGNSIFLEQIDNVVVSLPNDISGEMGKEYVGLAMSSFYTYITGAIALLFTFLIGVFLFKYQNEKRTVDMFYALPITKHFLFISRLVSGYLMLLVPLIISTIVTMILLSYSDASKVSIFYGFLNVALSMLASLMLVAFASVISSSTMQTVSVVVGLNLVTPIAIMLLGVLTTDSIVGVDALIPVDLQFATRLLPFLALFPLALNGFSSFDIFYYTVENDNTINEFINDCPIFDGGYIAIWIISVILLLVLSLVFISKRKSETAENSYVFKSIFSIERAFISVVAGIIFIFIFSAYSYTESTILAFVVGSLISHMLITLIVTRSLKNIAKVALNYICYAGISVGLYLILVNGWFGTATYVPNTQDVKEVKFAVNGEYNAYYQNYYDDDVEYNIAIYEDKENISDIVEFHNLLVEDLIVQKEKNHGDLKGDFDIRGILIEYVLNNGQIVQRYYSSGDMHYNYASQDFWDSVNEITAKESYKEQTLGVLKYDVSDYEYSNYIYTYNDAEDYIQEYSLIIEDAIKIDKALEKDLLENKGTKVDTNFYNYYDGRDYLMSYTYKNLYAVQFIFDKDEQGIMVEETYIIDETYKNTYPLIEKMWQEFIVETEG